jgi:hypothetical protein
VGNRRGFRGATNYEQGSYEGKGGREQSHY